MITLILIAFSLALDCFAVSMAGGALDPKPRLANVLKVALFFGLFQAIMPLIGWFIGISFARFIDNYAHWISFVLLAAIGIKMIYESLKSDDDCPKRNILNLPTLILLSIATSIDSLVVGITLGLLNTPLILSITVIGIFAFTLSVAGYYLGCRLSALFKTRIEILGGIILIAIGLNTLAEHWGWHSKLANIFTNILGL